MPLYEFRCSQCENRFEKLTSDAKTVICPHCGSSQVEKLISTFSCRLTAPATSSPSSSSAPCTSG